MSEKPISAARVAVDLLHRSPGWFYTRRKSLERHGFPKPIPVIKEYSPVSVRRAMDDLRLHFPIDMQCYEIDTYVPWKGAKSAPFTFEAWDGIPGVYLIGFGGFIKIGVSNNIRSRLQTIQRGLPEAISFHGAIIGANERDERDLHSRFASHRKQGEWFAAAPEIFDYIAAAKRGGRKK